MSTTDAPPPPSHSRVELVIIGLVQGVFYRASAREAAERLGLTGHVRNRPDGTVEAVAEGPRDVLEQFIAWCRQGPPSARVENVQTQWSAAIGEWATFEVRR